MVHLQGDIWRVREAETDAGRSRVELTATYVQGCQACRAKQTAFEIEVTPGCQAPASSVVRPASLCLLPAPCRVGMHEASIEVQAGMLPLLGGRAALQVGSAVAASQHGPDCQAHAFMRPGPWSGYDAWSTLPGCVPTSQNELSRRRIIGQGRSNEVVGGMLLSQVGRQKGHLPPVPPVPVANAPTHHEAVLLVHLSLTTWSASAV